METSLASLMSDSLSDTEFNCNAYRAYAIDTVENISGIVNPLESASIDQNGKISTTIKSSTTSISTVKVNVKVQIIDYLNTSD